MGKEHRVSNGEETVQVSYRKSGQHEGQPLARILHDPTARLPLCGR